MSRALSLPYGHVAPDPFWGPQTSAVNFCEEDYILTRYVAELVNTLTSVAYIVYGYLGIRRYKSEDVNVFSVVNLPYFGLIGIGVCSGLYHSTMKYHTQMADEMSMHLAMGCTLIRIFTFQQPLHIQRRNAAIITVGLTSFIIYHCVADEFVLHVILFFALSVTVGVKTHSMIKSRTESKGQKKRLSSVVLFAQCNALFAYFLWNLDVHFCSTLTSWKRYVGLPWGFALELHGWWHVMTAVSCYIFVAVIEFLTSSNGNNNRDGFLWPVKAVLEEFHGKGGSTAKVHGMGDANGYMNGEVKKRRE